MSAEENPDLPSSLSHNLSLSANVQPTENKPEPATIDRSKLEIRRPCNNKALSDFDNKLSSTHSDASGAPPFLLSESSQQGGLQKRAADPPEPNDPVAAGTEIKTEGLSLYQLSPNTNKRQKVDATLLGPDQKTATKEELEMSVDELFGKDIATHSAEDTPWEPFPTTWPDNCPKPSYLKVVRLDINIGRKTCRCEGTLYWISEEDFAMFYKRFGRIPNNDPPLQSATPWTMFSADTSLEPTWVAESFLASRLWDWPVDEGDEVLPRLFVAVTHSKEAYYAMTETNQDQSIEKCMLSSQSLSRIDLLGELRNNQLLLIYPFSKSSIFVAMKSDPSNAYGAYEFTPPRPVTAETFTIITQANDPGRVDEIDAGWIRQYVPTSELKAGTAILREDSELYDLRGNEYVCCLEAWNLLCGIALPDLVDESIVE